MHSALVHLVTGSFRTDRFEALFCHAALCSTGILARSTYSLNQIKDKDQQQVYLHNHCMIPWWHLAEWRGVHDLEPCGCTCTCTCWRWPSVSGHLWTWRRRS